MLAPRTIPDEPGLTATDSTREWRLLVRGVAVCAALAAIWMWPRLDAGYGLPFWLWGAGVAGYALSFPSGTEKYAPPPASTTLWLVVTVAPASALRFPHVAGNPANISIY